MKNRNKLYLAMLLTLAGLITSVHADIPRLIQYQGKATEKATGLPLSGNHNVNFRLYDSATTGTLLWQEQHLNLPVSNGNFAILLGSQNALNLPFDKPYWLSVEIDNDGEMSPRERLVSVPYAYKAAEASHAETAAQATEATHAITADILTTPQIPSGVIVMWSGSIMSIPAGWALCDGANGTPDLRDRFVICTGQKTNVGDKGERHGGLYGSGNDLYIMTNHHPGGWGNAPSGSDMCGGHSHTLMPPYYALAFIMKL